MTSKTRKKRKSKMHSSYINKYNLKKRYPNLMRKLLGKHRVGGNQLERLNILTKLSINLLFDNANNEDLIKLKSDLLKEGTDLETMIDISIEHSDKKPISPPIYSVKIFKLLMEIRNMKDVGKKYENELKNIARSIDRFDTFFSHKKRRDNRNLAREATRSARQSATVARQQSRQIARENAQEKREQERAKRELARASRRSSRM